MLITDVVIVGAGAAGLMCAIEAGKRDRKVIVLEHANKPGKKILMSGGGRCNFTNLNIEFDNYQSNNRHFLKSALSRYTQADFISLVKRHKIEYHEKKLGQLFCDNKSKDILDMLLLEAKCSNINIKLNSKIIEIEQLETKGFIVKTESVTYKCVSLVIASGGLSIPTMGASSFGYKVAEQFGIKVWPLRAALVPFVLSASDKEKYSSLSGASAECEVFNSRIKFRENILFTHRGISGPAILQMSSYWNLGENFYINFFPGIDLFDEMKKVKRINPNLILRNYLSKYLAKSILLVILPNEISQNSIHNFSDRELLDVANLLQKYCLKPIGTEGYRTAEVTLGGVDCDAICSKTMQAKSVQGLYFIGEVLDVTGWLGGYNFQWAWSSGWAAGQAV